MSWTSKFGAAAKSLVSAGLQIVKVFTEAIEALARRLDDAVDDLLADKPIPPPAA